MPGVRFVYLDMADWQDCTKAPQISTLPQIPLLRGRQEDRERESEGLKAYRERRLKNEHKEMGRERKWGTPWKRRGVIKWDYKT